MAKTAKANKERMGVTGLNLATADKLAHDASEVGLGLIALLAAMIGIWSIACLVGGIANAGVVDLITGYVSAVTGH